MERGSVGSDWDVYWCYQGQISMECAEYVEYVHTLFYKSKNRNFNMELSHRISLFDILGHVVMLILSVISFPADHLGGEEISYSDRY